MSLVAHRAADNSVRVDREYLLFGRLDKLLLRLRDALGFRIRHLTPRRWRQRWPVLALHVENLLLCFLNDPDGVPQIIVLLPVTRTGFGLVVLQTLSVQILCSIVRFFELKSVVELLLQVGCSLLNRGLNGFETPSKFDEFIPPFRHFAEGRIAGLDCFRGGQFLLHLRENDVTLRGEGLLFWFHIRRAKDQNVADCI
uniref:(northern house mosquito) hypothetical protein n=1 Tax=Culex pipiens TaxID=7175 RepID=A0A8D8AJG5_CULPI